MVEYCDMVFVSFVRIRGSMASGEESKKHLNTLDPRKRYPIDWGDTSTTRLNYSYCKHYGCHSTRIRVGEGVSDDSPRA